MAVEFRVLGPLEIRRDGAPVPLRAPAQRTFLAALLIAQGRVVSLDALAEALWPAEQPRSARHALEMNASRVRRLLGEDATVVARPPGYALEADPSAIDSVRFERLVAETRELAPAGAAARAADALALWRGPAYADFTFASFAQEEIARLEELRQDAEEERIAAELALGRAGELVGELEALVVAAPLRERRRAQLMLALYRAGRQADALAVYRDARELLLDELGLEPGVELRELERAILRQDESLAAGAVRARARAGAARRPASVVAVEPEIPLELDPEEHERQKQRAAELVARVAEHFDALQPEPFVLAFAHEDHVERAAAAAAALGTRVGIASGDALVGESSLGGPLVDLARQRARDGTGATPDVPVFERVADTPFVGREAELARLRDARVAIVLGPPGIGKSRLLEELGRNRPVAVAHCRAYGAEALAPLHELAGSLGAASALDGVPAEEIPLTLRRLCGANVMVAFDDAQWAAPFVLEAIEYLAAHVALVCLAREDLLEERPHFLAGAERITLAPLDDAHAVELAAGDAEIVARAEGNPLFIQQLRAHAQESDTPLPTTLRALLTARLDRLTPSERTAIQRAAVIGRDFDAALVNARPALAALGRRALVEPAPPTEAYEERFRFAHALIREAAYESIPLDLRATLHEELADTLDARGASDEIVGFHLERAAELWPVRDRHAQRLADDAGERLGSAGLAAAKRGHTIGAEALLARATALRPNPFLFCELAVALNTVGRRADAIAALERAEELGDRPVQLRARLERTIAGPVDMTAVAARAEEAIPVFEAIGDDRASGRAWMLLGWVRGGGGGQHAQWLDAAERAAAYYARAGWSTSTCTGQVAAALYFGPTPVADAVARCRVLLEGADLSGDATISGYLGGLLAMAGGWDESSALLERSREIFEDLGRVPSLTRTCAPLEARAVRLRGEPALAADILRSSCEQLLAEAASFHLATQASELADVLVDLGETDEAESWCALAERHLQADDLAGRISVKIARVRLSGGDGADELVALASRTDNLNARARAHVVAGDLERARELYEEKGNAVAAAAATTAS